MSIDLSRFLYRDKDESSDAHRPLHHTLELFESASLTRTKQTATMSSCSNQDGSCLLGNLIEKYCSPAHPESRLRMLIIGHNPSETAWRLGHYYANPSNRMWPILRECGIVPSHFTHENDDDCPSVVGLGFTDFGFGIPETDSSVFNDAILRQWALRFYLRIREHMERVYSSQSKGSSALENQDNHSLEKYAPKILAFCGVRQWKCLFPPNYYSSSSILHRKSDTTQQNSPQKKKQRVVEEFRYGLQSARPNDWPSYLNSCEVYVLPSTSGAAPMKTEDRVAPYRELSNYLRTIPWPLKE